jgi:hypothetical protein
MEFAGGLIAVDGVHCPETGCKRFFEICRDNRFSEGNAVLVGKTRRQCFWGCVIDFVENLSFLTISGT